MQGNGRVIRTFGAIVGMVLVAASVAGLSANVRSAAGLAGAAATRCRTSARTPVPQPTQAQLDAAGLGDLSLAPDTVRRDLVAAPFHHSTDVTNPLFPIAELDSAILNGHVDGKGFYTETTLLPFTRILEWTPGQCVRALVSQYTAFLDGRITETAIDLYAQSDDGSVWYLGEDVFDYDPAGRIVTTEGTWHAGIEGPMAMIMPSRPGIGDASRPENIPGTVFEEVTITEVDQTFAGPTGPVSGGIVGTETHQDGAHSDKLFAPGYGEFLSRDGADVEALALASPTDAVPGGVPPELTSISQGADDVFGSRLATPAQWARARADVGRMIRAWGAFREREVPRRLVGPTRLALHHLEERIAAHDRSGTRLAAIDAAYATTNLELRYRPPSQVDTIRFGLWARRALTHALAGSLGAVRSDQVTLEWVRDRFAHTVDPVTRTRIDALVGDLGVAVADDDLVAAAATARALLSVVGSVVV